MTNQHDTMPHNAEAEASTVATMILDPVKAVSLLEIAKPGDYYLVKHQWIAEAVQALTQRGVNPDYVLLSDELKTTQGDNDELNRLHSIGGAAFLSGLMSTVSYTTLPEENAAIVAKLAQARREIAAAAEIAMLGYNSNGDAPQEIHRKAQAILDGVRPDSKSDTTTKHADTLDMEARQAEIRARPPLVPWPWPSQRGYIRHLYGGLTLVVAAETNVGKTIFMECLAEHAAATKDTTVLYYHNENTDEEMLHRRVLRLAGGVTMDDMREGYYGPEVEDAEAIIRGWPGRIDYIGCWGWTAAEIVADAKQKLREDDTIKVVIVDYFQKIKLDYKGAESTTNCEGRQFETLTTFCVDNNLSVVIGSQMNKQSYGSKRKVAANARGTGEIAEKANIAITLAREINDSDQPERNAHGVIVAQPGGMMPQTTIRFDKNKGPTGEMQMWCNGPRFRFDEISSQPEPADPDF